MQIPPSFRTAEMEQAYQIAQQRNALTPLAELRGPKIRGLTIVENGFMYDTLFSRNDMLLNPNMSEYEFYHRAIDLWLERRLGHGHLMINAPRMQSAPDVPHLHLLTLKSDRKDFKL